MRCDAQKLLSVLIPLDGVVPGLEAAAESLVDAAILRHRHKEVQLLAACCLAEILRLYAPNPPFTLSQQKVSCPPPHPLLSHSLTLTLSVCLSLPVSLSLSTSFDRAH